MYWGLPTTKKGQLTTKFPRLMNYLSRLDPELSIIAWPLRELTSSQNTLVWHQHHTDIFELTKQKICKCTALQFFDPCKTTHLEFNSSLIAITCTLLQNPDEKRNEHGQCLEINPYAHKLPDVGLRQLIHDELKSINKRQPAFFANIIHVSRGVVHEWYTPSTPVLVVIHPPHNTIFTIQRTLKSFHT